MVLFKMVGFYNTGGFVTTGLHRKDDGKMQKNILDKSNNFIDNKGTFLARLHIHLYIMRQEGLFDCFYIDNKEITIWMSNLKTIPLLHYELFRRITKEGAMGIIVNVKSR